MGLNVVVTAFQRYLLLPSERVMGSGAVRQSHVHTDRDVTLFPMPTRAVYRLILIPLPGEDCVRLRVIFRALRIP